MHRGNKSRSGVGVTGPGWNKTAWAESEEAKLYLARQGQNVWRDNTESSRRQCERLSGRWWGSALWNADPSPSSLPACEAQSLCESLDSVQGKGPRLRRRSASARRSSLWRAPSAGAHREGDAAPARHTHTKRTSNLPWIDIPQNPHQVTESSLSITLEGDKCDSVLQDMICSKCNVNYGLFCSVFFPVVFKQATECPESIVLKHRCCWGPWIQKFIATFRIKRMRKISPRHYFHFYFTLSLYKIPESQPGCNFYDVHFSQ